MEVFVLMRDVVPRAHQSNQSQGGRGFGWGVTGSLDAVIVRLGEFIKEFVRVAPTVEFEDDECKEYFLSLALALLIHNKQLYRKD